MLITQYAGVLLRREMDRIPLWRGNHVSIKDLADYFAKYVYLPRLKNTDVLLEPSAMACNRSGNAKHLPMPKAGTRSASSISGSKRANRPHVLNANSLIVKPEVALAHITGASAPVTAAPQQLQPVPPATYAAYAQAQDYSLSALGEREGSTATALPEPPPTIFSPTPLVAQAKGPKYQRFHGSVIINERKMGTEAGNIMEEVVKHLTSLYSVKVKVTLEIEAELQNGASEDTVRTVLENCRTLKFEEFGFEEE